MRLHLALARALVILVVAAGRAAAQSTRPMSPTSPRELNAPDESMTPRGVRCRALPNATAWNATDSLRLRDLLRDSSAAVDRAAALEAAFPALRTFEQIETHACTLLGHGASSLMYTAFVDSVVPLVLAVYGTDAPTISGPHTLGPRDGIRYDIYPRRTTVIWSTVTGADHYLLEVQSLTHFQVRKSSGEVVDMGQRWIPHNDGLHDAEVRDTTATFYFIGAQPGRWRVRAVLPDGRSTAPSGWRTFDYLK